ncbi:hypothetical protein Cgig2_033534 [Carnegiea gigantea]|uniref:SLC26A/SulP transporter domain-containing protein n=1 Tax=Carnegiea gigantea TaxID=171969 RepID=A0A9Q1K194_9CARY|nr:hypothetical protein Cgig2_033534 [Carnegiea gigantea]
MMGTVEEHECRMYPTQEVAMDPGKRNRVVAPPPQPLFKSLRASLKEALFPDDPFRKLKNQPKFSRKLLLGLQYFFPILEWGPRYSFGFFKSDLISGITIASLAIPQGISYSQLAKLPPILGLCSSFIPPLVYAVLGSSRDLAVGTSAVGSLLIGSMLSRVVNPNENPKLFLHLAFTATLVAGIFQASLGILRLGLIVDLLSHATIVGFVGGAAIVVCLQQLKGMLGLHHFTEDTDLVSVMRFVWRWESATLGCFFFFSLLLTRYISKRRAKLFWISAIAPLTSVIVGSLVAYLTHAERHGTAVIGDLKEGLNPPSFKDFALSSPYFPIAVKTGIVAGVVVTAVSSKSLQAIFCFGGI